MRFLKNWSLAQTFAALASAQVIGRITRFLYLAIIAQFLTPDEVGVYTYGIALYLAFLGFSSFGQNVLLATRIGRRPASAAVIAAHSLTLVAITITLATFLLAFFVWFTAEGAAERLSLTYFLLALIARTFALWARGCFTALERVGWIPRYEFLFRGSEAVAGTVLLTQDAGLAAICFLHFFVWLIEAFASFLLLRRRTTIRVRPGLERRLLIKVTRISLIYAVSLSMMQVFSQIGVVGLKFTEPDAAIVAQFAIALQLVTAMMVFPIAFGQAMLPGLSRARRTDHTSDILAVTTVFKSCLVVGGSLAIVIGVFGPWLISLFFGSRYTDAGRVFVTLSWALGPYAAIIIAQQSLNALGARRQAALIAVGMVVVFMAFLLMHFPIAPLSQATAAFIVAVVTGTVGSALALTARVGLSGPGWWLRPAILLALIGLTFELVHDSGQSLMTLLLIPVLLTGALVCRVFDRTEISAIASKLTGRWQRA